jgi:hypothetical protein
MHYAHLVQHGSAVVGDDGLALAGLNLDSMLEGETASTMRLHTILSIPLGPSDYNVVSAVPCSLHRGTYSSDRISHRYTVKVSYELQ